MLPLPVGRALAVALAVVCLPAGLTGAASAQAVRMVRARRPPAQRRQATELRGLAAARDPSAVVVTTARGYLCRVVRTGDDSSGSRGWPKTARQAAALTDLRLPRPHHTEGCVTLIARVVARPASVGPARWGRAPPSCC